MACLNSWLDFATLKVCVVVVVFVLVSWLGAEVQPTSRFLTAGHNSAAHVFARSAPAGQRKRLSHGIHLGVCTWSLTTL